MAQVAETWEGRHDPDDEFAHEEVDPRVEQYLEQMNRAADDINKCENKYEEVRTAFQEALGKIEADLNKTAQRVGRKTVEKARPYFEALYRAQKAHFESRRTAKHFEDISSAYLKAKHAVADVEKRAEQQGRLDEQLQAEMNRVNSRFIRADLRRKKAEQLHLTRTKEFQHADARLTAILKQRKKSIIKARPYFEAKARFDKIIRALKAQLQQQEQETKAAKKRSQHAMHMLMQISQEIHERRAKEKEQHASGVDAAPNSAPASSGQEHAQQESNSHQCCNSGVDGVTSSQAAHAGTTTDSDSPASSDHQLTAADKDQLSPTERIDRELANARRLQKEHEAKERVYQQETQRLLNNAARYEEQHGAANNGDDDDAVSTASTEATEDDNESVDEDELARVRPSYGDDDNGMSNNEQDERGGSSSTGDCDSGHLDLPTSEEVDAAASVADEHNTASAADKAHKGRCDADTEEATGDGAMDGEENKTEHAVADAEKEDPRRTPP